MPNNVFRDIKLEKEFYEKGYVIVPFLSPEEVEDLTTKFFETIHESGGPKRSGKVDYDSKQDISYDFTFIDENIEYKKKVFDIITQKFSEKAGEYLNNYKPIIANYIRKKEGGGEVPMHQNWAFVDEEKYTSVSIWVPLVDSNEENGTLQMVDGSHKRFGKHRGPMVPWELKDLKEPIISSHLTPMNVKAGQGVILDDSIVHYSDINKTPGLRLAIQLIMIPEEATSLHYHLDREKDLCKISVLETNVDFYTHFHPWLKPQNVREIKTLPHEDVIYTYQDFLKGLKAKRFDEQLPEASLSVAIDPLFSDKETQNKFEEDGYVKISLLNEKEVEELKRYYESLQHDHIGKNGFHVSLDSKDEKYINGVFDKLFSVIVPKLDPLLHNYKTFTASYVTKEAGLQNIVPPHQDWTFVDEEHFSSATVWIPLIDVNKNNGALGVIKGSHKLFTSPRISPSPQAKTVLSDHLFNIFPYVEVIEMKAGEALIFNNRTIHASPPNISGITRIGAGIGITQKGAQLRHYYKLPDSNKVEIYNVDEAFFKKYNNALLSSLYSRGEKPRDLQLVDTIQKEEWNLSKDEMVELICSVKGVQVNTELMNELASLYNYNINCSQKTKPVEVENKVKQNEEPANGRLQNTLTDQRTLFQKYTLPNIIAEVKYRLKRK